MRKRSAVERLFAAVFPLDSSTFGSPRAGIPSSPGLAKSDPGKEGWQRDLSALYGKLALAFKKERQKGKLLMQCDRAKLSFLG
jgi:hypothetical protein